MATELYGYLIVDNDMAINTLPDETEDYALLPGSIAFVIGGGAYILTPSYKWVYLNHDLQKLMLPVFDGKASSGGGGGGGGSSALIVGGTYDDTTYSCTLDKTWKEIHDAVANGGIVIVNLEEAVAAAGEPFLADCGLWIVTSVISPVVPGDLYAIEGSTGNSWGTDSEDGFPAAYFGD